MLTDEDLPWRPDEDLPPPSQEAQHESIDRQIDAMRPDFEFRARALAEYHRILTAHGLPDDIISQALSDWLAIMDRPLLACAHCGRVGNDGT